MKLIDKHINFPENENGLLSYSFPSWVYSVFACTARVPTFFCGKEGRQRKPPGKKLQFFPVGATIGCIATALPS